MTGIRIKRHPDVLTTSQVAAACGVTSQTVRSWIEAGLLRSWRIGPEGWRYVSRRDLIRSGFTLRLGGERP